MFSNEELDVSCRVVTDQDDEFLFDVFFDTRIEEVSKAGWNDEQIQEFMNLQYRAQSMHYEKHFPDSERLVLLKGNTPIGRLLIDYRSDEIRIIDIAILIKYRNLGVGNFFVREVMNKADSMSLPLSIHVERYNPAMRLYKRLGFKVIQEGDVYHLLEYAGSK